MSDTKRIRKELAILIQQKQKSCITDQERNKAVNDARCEMNKKYGNNWRFEDAGTTATGSPTFYEGHTFGEHWMD
jgi:hypothetical protein